MKIAFRIISDMERFDTGKVTINLVPDRDGIVLTDQQILDAVAEMLLWQEAPPEKLDDSEFDS